MQNSSNFGQTLFSWQISRTKLHFMPILVSKLVIQEGVPFYYKAAIATASAKCVIESISSYLICL